MDKNKIIDYETFLQKKEKLNRDKFLINLYKEIKKYESELKEIKDVNSKNAITRKLKILFKTLQMVAPCALFVGFTFVGATLIDYTPFIVDEVVDDPEMQKIYLNSAGLYYSVHPSYENAKSTLTYYSNWILLENNLYTRVIESYSINTITKDELDKLMSKEGITSLTEIFGDPIGKVTETSNNLTEEELAKEAFFEAILFAPVGFNEVPIVIRDTVKKNTIETAIWIILNIWFISAYVYANTIDSNYKSSVENIKKRYPHIDTEDLTRKLEMKREEYNRKIK